MSRHMFNIQMYAYAEALKSCIFLILRNKKLKSVLYDCTAFLQA